MPSNSNLGFQVEWCTLAKCLASLLSTEDSYVLSIIFFCYFWSFDGAILPSSIFLSLSFSSFASLDWGVGRAGKEEGEGED